jgi:predicted AlkP superfamily pyrophosphatase or phosphodiesterase
MDICRRKFGACILAGLASRAWALPPRPKLLVLVVLEQFRPDYLDIVWSQIGATGLRRLVENGAYFPDCRNLASTFSGSSLATLATGAWPAQHGIVADRWYDRSERGAVRASAEGLLATSLTTQVIAASGSSRAFVVALDERTSSLVAGTPIAQRYWMDEEGRFATWGDTPVWLAEYNRMKPLSDLHGAEWLAVGAKPGAPALRTLKYDPAHPQDFLDLYLSSPFSQGAELEFTGELLTREHIGQGDTFDMLSVVLSTSARLGYETGASSPLMQQLTLHLDRQIGALLDQLDRAPGRGMYDLVLVGAHGAPPEPPALARPRMAVNGESLAQSIQRRLATARTGRILKYLYPFLYLESSGGRVPETTALAAAHAALEDGVVAAYYTAGGECSVQDDWERRFRNSFHPQRSGDVMLSYQPEYIEETGSGRGVSYGSLYNYDTKVPLCFFGPQFRPGVFESPVELVDVAPTVARAIGVPPPSSSTGRVLGEAFLGAEDLLR